MTPPRPKSRLAPAMIVAGFLLLLVAYPLSIGPAWYCLPDDGSIAPPAWYRVLYSPIDSACEHSDTLASLLHWYLHLWGMSDVM